MLQTLGLGRSVVSQQEGWLSGLQLYGACWEFFSNRTLYLAKWSSTMCVGSMGYVSRCASDFNMLWFNGRAYTSPGLGILGLGYMHIIVNPIVSPEDCLPVATAAGSRP